MSSEIVASLYDCHAAALFRFLMTLTGHEADARDILQELFLRLARRPAAAVVNDPQAWLFRAARNLTIDHSRRRGARDRALSRMAENGSHPFAPSDNDEAERHRRNVSTALAALPEEQRAVVHLKIWEDLTFARIAEVLEIPANTAASRYRYAMQRLRATLLTTVPHDEL